MPTISSTCMHDIVYIITCTPATITTPTATTTTLLDYISINRTK